MIRLHDKEFVPYISKEKIQKRVTELAKQIDEDHKDKKPLFIGILNGSFMFAADIFRAITIHAEISFIKLASYVGTTSGSSVITAIGLTEKLENKHVVILEDILDSGRTLSSFLPVIEMQKPASIKIATLLTKPTALRYDIRANYVGFTIPDKFVVGYGLDYNGLGRNLPDIHMLADQ